VKKLILFALASLAIISCRKDDDNEETKPSFVGTWKLIDYRFVSGKDGSIIYSNTIPESDCRKKSNYIYKTNGKFINEFFLNPITGECGNIAFQDEMDYIYNESTKTMTYKADGLTRDIVTVNSLSKTELQIVVSDKADQNSDGIIDKVIGIYIKQ